MPAVAHRNHPPRYQRSPSRAAERERARRERDVADVERIRRTPHGGREAEQEAERDVRAPARRVAFEGGGHPGAPLRRQEGPRPPRGDRLGEPVDGDPVLEPAARDAAHPQEDARERGEEDGPAVERAQGLERARVFGVEKRVARREPPKPVEERRARPDGNDVGDGGREVRAREAPEERRDPLQPILSLVRRDDLREGRGRHRRLLRREDEAERLEKQEAHGVVEAVEEALGERRETEVVNGHLERRRQDGQQTASCGRGPDVPVVPPVRRDVVLARFARALDDLAVEEVEVPLHEVADRAILMGERRETDEPAVRRARGLEAGFRRGARRRPGRAGRRGDSATRHGDDRARRSRESPWAATREARRRKPSANALLTGAQASPPAPAKRSATPCTTRGSTRGGP